MTESMSTELQAMVQVEAALKALDEAEMTRVMQWAVARFGVHGPSKKVENGVNASRSSVGTGPSLGVVPDAGGAYTEFATFYDAANPKSDADKALVSAYWIQFHENNPDVESQSVNNQLKHLGYAIGNITRALEALKMLKPALIVQTRKEGSTKQARKRFKVTSEGKKAVQALIDAPR
jgi:hypothetical protein